MSSLNFQSPFQPDQIRNYQLLMQRWKRLVKAHSFLRLRMYGEAEGYPLMLVESKREIKNAPSLYVSTGIHGDEPAGVEGLIQWAGDSLHTLDHWNIQLFPCLNPWGIERNIRADSEGRDLNRCYHSKKVPQIAAQLAAMKGRHYDLAISLHEDYDARGFYLYEVASQRKHWGESLRDELAPFMAPDSRRKIDASIAKNGVIRRKIKKGIVKGDPESFCLHFHHAKRTFTFETPSEHFLERRVEIHHKFLEISTGKLLFSPNQLASSSSK